MRNGPVTSATGPGTGSSSASATLKLITTVTSPAGSLPVCRDNAVLLADKKTCSLSPNINYVYRVTYTVPGIDNWKSAPGLATRP